METFSVKFRVGNLDLSMIVTGYEHHRQFKVEMVTREPDPILLTRSVDGVWTVMERGARNFSDRNFQELEDAIENKLTEMYGVSNMLVLTDFSDTALNAARYGAALAYQLKTRNLILYHSYASIAVPPPTFAPLSRGFTDSLDESKNRITELKNDLQAWAPEQTGIETLTDDRALVPAVNTLVEQHHIGLVVAGITGKSNLEKILIGSNTISLAKNGRVPLLIVPPVAAFQPIKTIVFACDLKRVSQSTPAFAIKTLVQALGARLLLLNVDDDGEHFNPDTISEMTDLHQIWDDQQVEYHYINHKDTVAGIMEFAGQQRAELVITIPKERGFFENIFHRSMTSRLAYHTYLPLLLFKEDI